MAKFIAECGKTFDVPQNKQHFTGILLGREYHPEDMKKDNRPIPKECQECKVEKHIYGVSLHRDGVGLFGATDTTCFAKREDFKELPTVTEYHEGGCNTTEKYTFEVILQTDEFRTIILYESPPSRNISAFDYIKEMAESLWEKFADEAYKEEDGREPDCIRIQMVNMERGQADYIEFYRMEELENAIISVRLVGFEQKNR
ncbi:hypothetical protein [Sporomusa aerivorans]|uniref:hypothetical protein n=1 Tax=Sporomusa aerivorans TaxID=204936 RepID=UPI00352B9AFB